jgi:hypothetical protein
MGIHKNCGLVIYCFETGKASGYSASRPQFEAFSDICIVPADCHWQKSAGIFGGEKIFAYFAMKSNNEMVETGKSPAHHFC